MKVRTKLYACAFVGLAGLATVGVFSLIGMKFVGKQIHLLTEKSTPAQLKTIDLQRALQEHTSNLLRVQVAATRPELSKAREDAGKSLSDVSRVSLELDALNGGGASGKEKVEQLSGATQQIEQTTGDRIAASVAASDSLKSMNEHLRAMSTRLSVLDESIRKVQTRSSGSLASSNESVSKITSQQKNIQAMKDFLKDMKLALMELSSTDSARSVPVAKNHFNSAYRFLMGNELVKAAAPGAGKFLAESLPEIGKAVLDKGGLVDTKTALLGAAAEEESKKSFDTAIKQVTQKVTNLLSDMEARTEVNTAEVTTENEKFESSLKGSNSAGGILAQNGQLTALGSTIEGRVGLLFGVRDSKQLDRLSAEIQEKISSAEKVARKEGELLSAGGYKGEAKSLSGVLSSLGEVRGTLFSKGGVLEKLKESLTIEEKANALSVKIREMVEKQREEGSRGVTLAQGEQEKTVLAVNGIVQSSIVLVSAVGAVCMVVGTLLGTMLVRSITKQIHSLSELAEAFGEGDLTARMDDSPRDEFGLLASRFNHTAENLGDMTGRIADAISTLSAGSEELAAAAEEMSASATEVAAMTRTNADNASRTNGLMTQSLSVVQRSDASMRELTGAMVDIAQSSEEAGRIVKTINLIATQTNLLALNAAVEAAHAGAAGEGFAVVASEVKNLAARAAEAARNTEELINGIVLKVHHGGELVASTNEAIQEVVAITGSIGELVAGIASASNEQAMGIGEISQGVSEITRVSQANSESAQMLSSAISTFKTC